MVTNVINDGTAVYEEKDNIILFLSFRLSADKIKGASNYKIKWNGVEMV